MNLKTFVEAILPCTKKETDPEKERMTRIARQSSIDLGIRRKKNDGTQKF